MAYSPPMAFSRALVARGALAGALGGAVAGAVDFAGAAGRAAAVLPPPQLRPPPFLAPPPAPLAAALSPLLPLGPRARLRFAAPAGLEAAAWALGLVAGAGAVGALLLSLEGRPRMPLPLKALNTALWTPALIVVALAVAHAVARG